ncbi:TPA: hypothetical protein QCU60_001252 [Bacillus cereus]|nr:hypothetical protein [Bacillus cereus]
MQQDLKEKIEPYLQKEEEITKKIVMKTVELVSTRKKLSTQALVKKLDRDIDSLI